MIFQNFPSAPLGVGVFLFFDFQKLKVLSPHIYLALLVHVLYLYVKTNSINLMTKFNDEI